MLHKILGKGDISKEPKEKKEETHVAVGAPAYRRTIERRVNTPSPEAGQRVLEL